MLGERTAASFFFPFEFAIEFVLRFAKVLYHHGGLYVDFDMHLAAMNPGDVTTIVLNSAV